MEIEAVEFNEDYLKNVKPLLLKVFNKSIFAWEFSIRYPFNDSIEASIFLFCHGYKPFDTQTFWNVLRDSILELGDTFVYEVLTMTEDYFISILEPNKDCQLSHSSCQAIFSSSGTWGLSEHSDGFSFLGGSHSFINSIRKSIPELDEQFSDFLKTFKVCDYGVDDTWLPQVLLKIYGEERAKELLEEAEEMGVYFSSSDESQ